MRTNLKDLSYGAFKTLNENLQQQVTKSTLTIELLKQECLVQNKVIKQLKLLHVSSLKRHFTNYCDAGHWACQIQHKKYNFVNYPVKIQDQDPEKLSKRYNSAGTDNSFFEKLAKKIDLLKFKYEMPPNPLGAAVVASEDTVFINKDDVNKL